MAREWRSIRTSKFSLRNTPQERVSPYKDERHYTGENVTSDKLQPRVNQKASFTLMLALASETVR